MASPVPHLLFGSCLRITPSPSLCRPSLDVPRPAKPTFPVPKYPPGLFSLPISLTYPENQREILIWSSSSVAKELALRLHDRSAWQLYDLELSRAHNRPQYSPYQELSAPEYSSSPERVEDQLAPLASSTPVKRRFFAESDDTIPHIPSSYDDYYGFLPSPASPFPDMRGYTPASRIQYEADEVERRLMLFRRFMEEGGLLPAGQWTLGEQEAEYLFKARLPKTLKNQRLYSDSENSDNEDPRSIPHQMDGSPVLARTASLPDNSRGHREVTPTPQVIYETGTLNTDHTD